jgi:hypothetical protein
MLEKPKMTRRRKQAERMQIESGSLGGWLAGCDEMLLLLPGGNSTRDQGRICEMVVQNVQRTDLNRRRRAKRGSEDDNNTTTMVMLAWAECWRLESVENGKGEAAVRSVSNSSSSSSQE